MREPAHITAELFDWECIGGRELFHVALEPVGVGVQPEHPPVTRGHARKVLIIHDPPPLDRTELAPDLMVGACRYHPHEGMAAAVDVIPLPHPGRAQTPGEGVRLEDLNFVAIHPGIAAGRKAADPGTDNNYFLHGGHLSFPGDEMGSRCSPGGDSTGRQARNFFLSFRQTALITILPETADVETPPPGSTHCPHI